MKTQEFSFLYNHLFVSDRGVELQKGISRKSRFIPYSQINSLTIRGTTLRIMTGNSRDTIVYSALRRPDEIKELIERRMHHASPAR